MATDPAQQTGFGALLARAAGGDEATVLAGRRLSVVRAFVGAIFAVAVVVYSVDLFALWDEAHRIQLQVDHETRNFFGLTWQERVLLTGSSFDTPAWYPVFVVIRQLILDVVAVGIAWLIYSRRPRHWMAYLSTLFILLAPWLGHLVRSSNRLEGNGLIDLLAELLGMAALITLFAFFWLFPDGQFRGALVRFLGGVIVLVLGAWVIGALVAATIGEKAGDALFISGFLVLLAAVLFWAVTGVVLQIWRYRHAPLPNRRLARWNLAFLVAIPLWFEPFNGLHDLFGEENEDRDTKFGFVWEQIHETLYLLAPVLLGVWVLFLVRRQGWWDFQTLWNRTAVYGIGLLALGALYGAALGLVTVATAPLSTSGQQVVAVVAATAAVAFAYGPLLGRVRRWVDERWFPRRAEVDQLSRSFADELRVADSPAAVPELLTTAVQSSLNPDHIELWTVAGGERR